jgi:hypothetical protein
MINDAAEHGRARQGGGGGQCAWSYRMPFLGAASLCIALHRFNLFNRFISEEAYIVPAQPLG